jgi:hydrogenase maturation protein HypF
VTWDGTGYGTDGTVWGGEFLLGDAAGFERVAHLLPFRLPGGEAAVREPRRAALALLWALLGEDAFTRTDLAALRSFSESERTVIARMLARGVNAPLTTSAGRLFDGVAALIGLHSHVTFEGQAAIALEHEADLDERGAYPVEVAPVAEPAGAAGSPTGRSDRAGRGPLIVDWRPTVAAALDDVTRGVKRSTIAARFHAALVQAIAEVARAVGVPRVVLTGGCFQNRLLTERAAARLAQAGHEVLLHRLVPPNDGGVSLGQAAVAAARLMGG